MKSPIRFTTRAAIIDGIRFKAIYSMAEDETITLKLTDPEGKQATVTLKTSDEHYQAARAAYDEKLAKRTGGTETDLEMVKGMKLDAGWFRIEYRGDIDRCTVTFKKKPSLAIRETVKAYGFWWAPTNGCWSRKLNNSAWWAGQELYKKLTA